MRRLIPALLLAGLLAAPLARAGDFGDAQHFSDLSPDAQQRLLAREATLLGQIKAWDVDQWHTLERLRADAKSDPSLRAEYLVALARAAREMRLVRSDPEWAKRMSQMTELEGQLRSLAVGFRDLSAKKQKAQREQMEQVAGQLFDLRQAERRARIAEMEKRLQEMREAVEKRDLSKQERIERYLDQLVAQPPPAPPNPPAPPPKP